MYLKAMKNSPKKFSIYKETIPMNMINRAMTVCKGEDGASNLEFIVLASVTLVIASVLFLFRDQIMRFVNSATSKVGDMTSTVNTGFGHEAVNGNIHNGGF